MKRVDIHFRTNYREVKKIIIIKEIVKVIIVTLHYDKVQKHRILLRLNTFFVIG